MLAKVNSAALYGIDALRVEVEIDLASGLPQLATVGLPEGAVKESKDRIRAAVKNCGYTFPAKRITINLAPADIKKEGSAYDLPMAVGILAAEGSIEKTLLDEYLVIGELSLDGTIKAVRGALSIAMAAKKEKVRGIILPEQNAPEAAVVKEVEVLGVRDLPQVVELLNGSLHVEPTQVNLDDLFNQHSHYNADFNDVKGQQHVKRALEVAAAGGHNLLMIGPPGSGKSMLAARLPGILPPLEPAEALEVSMIHSIAGGLPDGKLLRERPFREPHHSASLPALVGGGMRAKPGEISLAHKGVLFLDELPEFQRATLEALRQPVETGRIAIARANAHVSYPARFQMVAAMNPCRCGHLDDPALACNRAPRCALDYQAKISGPLFDRIDLHVEVPAVSAADLSLPPPREGSADVAARVQAARAIQLRRYEALPEDRRIATNAEADGALLEEVATPDADGRKLLTEATDRMKLSARGYHRVLRVARTLADLEAAPTVRRIHIAEALAYRRIAPGR